MFIFRDRFFRDWRCWSTGFAPLLYWLLFARIIHFLVPGGSFLRARAVPDPGDGSDPYAFSQASDPYRDDGFFAASCFFHALPYEPYTRHIPLKTGLSIWRRMTIMPMKRFQKNQAPMMEKITKCLAYMRRNILQARDRADPWDRTRKSRQAHQAEKVLNMMSFLFSRKRRSSPTAEADPG